MKLHTSTLLVMAGMFACAPLACGSLPTGWSDTDIGAPSQAGAASYTNGIWTVAGGGADIWSTNDQCNLLSMPLDGDGAVAARVMSQTGSDPYAQAGVMIRGDSSAGAAEASVSITPGNGISFRYRPTAGTSTVQTLVGSLTTPIWVRLSRSNNLMTATYSSDGRNWTQVGAAQTVSMGSSVLAGLAVTAHNNASLNTAAFRCLLLVPGPQVGVSGEFNNQSRAVLTTVPTWPLPQINVVSNALTPAMGWNSWFVVGDSTGPSESLIKSTADSLVSSGLAAAGYKYVVIDCTWIAQGRGSRDTNGNLIVDATRWPSEMKALADYVHSKGLLMGGYSDIGAQGYGTPAQIGGYAYYQQDADQYAAWGWDFIKIDDCGPGDFYAASHAMAHNASGRPIVVSFSTPQTDALKFATRFANSFRVHSDISFDFGWVRWDMVNGVGIVAEFEKAMDDWYSQAPGHWSDPDMVCTGLNGINDTEGRSHFNMWAILAAPLMIGTDVRASGGNFAPALSAATLTTLTNLEVIAVDQDSLGAVGRPVAGTNVYAKPLGSFTSGQNAVLILNRSGSSASFVVDFASMGLVSGGTATVRDLWAHQDLGSFAGSYTSPSIASHGSMMLKVTGTFDWSRPRTYEAESGYNTLGGSAYFVPHSDTFSATAYVTGVGSGAGNTLQFNKVAVQNSGVYNIEIDYACSAARSAQLSVNGGAPTPLSFSSTGSDTQPGVLRTSVQLNAGLNTLAFSNASNAAPNFDSLVVSNGTTQVTSTAFVAYNDCAWTANSGQTPSANDVTGTFTTNSPMALLNGNLIDANGVALPIQVAFSTNAAVNVGLLDRAFALPQNSDAATYFAGKIGTNCAATWSSGSIGLTFSGLNATSLYSIVLWSTRGADGANYSNRFTDITLSGADAYTNVSTSDAERFAGTAGTRIRAALTPGRVARYDGINPGSDGAVTFTLTAGGDLLWPVGVTTAGYLNAFAVMTSTNQASTNAPPPQPTSWTLTTTDTTCTLGIGGDGKLYISDLRNPAANWNWTASPSQIPLLSRVDMNSTQYAPNWVYRSAMIDSNSGTTVTLDFTNANPAMELTSTWQARSGPGPVRHTMFIKNNSGQKVTIYEQESLDVHVVGPGPAGAWCFNDGGSNPQDPTHASHDALGNGYSRTLDVSENQDYIPYVVVDANNSNGVYIGWEWSIGRIAIAANSAPNGAYVKAGNGDSFKTDIDSGETFEVPPGFIGAYQGDIDDAGNSLRKYLFSYNIPATVRNDPTFPKVEWNAFNATAVSQGSWKSTETKYYPLVDLIAPLGFEEVMIDVGWWAGDTGHWASPPIGDLTNWPSGMLAARNYAHSKGMRFGLYWNDNTPMTTTAGIQQRESEAQYLYTQFQTDIYRSDGTAGNVLQTGGYGAGTRADYAEDQGYWQTKGYYEVLDWLYANVTNFSYENCSDGGRMKDFGIMRRAFKIQCVDSYSPLDNQCGFYDSLYALPAAQISGVISSGSGNQKYWFRSASMGAARIEPDPMGWTQQQKDDCASAVATYKTKIRPLIRSANVYHIFPRPNDSIWTGMQFHDSATGKGVVYVFRPNNPSNSYTVQLKGLNAQTTYSVSSDDGSVALTSRTGASLMQSGLTIQLNQTFTSDIIFIDQSSLLTQWTAYNDCAWTVNSGSTPSGNDVTGMFTTNSPLSPTISALMNTNGVALPVQVSFVTSGAVNVGFLDRGFSIPAGTDVATWFGGKLGTNNAINWISGNLAMNLSGLDTGKLYNIVLWSTRGADGANYSNRFTDISISGVDGFANHSSSGTELLDASARTRVRAALTPGLVAKYDNVNPGSDGVITFTLTAGADGLWSSAGWGATNGYLNGFMIQTVPDVTVPDSWKIQYFGSTNIDLNTDPDHDGLTCLQEYISGTLPNSAASLPQIGMTLLGGVPAVDFNGVTQRLYSVDYRPNLLSPWQPLATEIMGSNAVQNIMLTITNRWGYYRFRVKLAP